MSDLSDIAEGMWQESRDNFENIPYMREMICDYIEKVYHIDKADHDDHYKKFCKELQEGTDLVYLRRVAVLVLYLNEYQNQEMAKLLRVSTRTIGRDLRFVKDKLYSKWKMRYG